MNGCSLMGRFPHCGSVVEPRLCMGLRAETPCCLCFLWDEFDAPIVRGTPIYDSPISVFPLSPRWTLGCRLRKTSSERSRCSRLVLDRGDWSKRVPRFGTHTYNTELERIYRREGCEKFFFFFFSFLTITFFFVVSNKFKKHHFVEMFRLYLILLKIFEYYIRLFLQQQTLLSVRVTSVLPIFAKGV